MAVTVERKNLLVQGPRGLLPPVVFDPVNTGVPNVADMRFMPVRTNDAGINEGDVWYNATKERLQLQMGNGTSRTIVGRRIGADGVSIATITAGGVMDTAGKTYIQLAANSGTADDLDTLSPIVAAHLQVGDFVILKADTGDTITVKHNVGNMHLDGAVDQVLVNNNHLILIWGGVDWYQLTPMTVIA